MLCWGGFLFVGFLVGWFLRVFMGRVGGFSPSL